MAEERKDVIAQGLEETSLTRFMKDIRMQMEAYKKKHPSVHFMAISTNSKQGTDILIGDEKSLAKEFVEIASAEETFENVLSDVLTILK